MIKKILFFLYAAVTVCMGAATIVEKYKGTDYTTTHVYGAWWFTLLWAVLAAVAIAYFVRGRVRRASTVTLHLSFVIILLGALITHLFSTQGMIHLRMNEETTTYFVRTDNAEGAEERKLPFSMRLDKFEIKYKDGTTAVFDYESHFTITNNGQQSKGVVSMNNIYIHDGIRLYQSSYDKDERGSILSLNRDPWGIPVTYAGYALLFITLVWMLLDPKGAFRRTLRHPLLRKGVLVVALLAGIGGSAKAQNTLPKGTAEKLGELNILYNDRICPLQTFAIDFTKKLYGSRTYKELTAEQVLAGFIFWGDEWSGEPIIKMKSGELKSTLQLPDYCSVNTFFNQDMGGYIIGPYVTEFYQGNHDKFHKQVGDLDDRLMLIMELRRGTLLKVFPCSVDGKITWFSPTDSYPKELAEDHRLFMQNIFSLLNEEAHNGNFSKMDEYLGKMLRYQQDNGGSSLPTERQIKAERIYNKVPFATVLFMFNLTLGVLMLFFTVWRIAGARRSTSRSTALVIPVGRALMVLSMAALTFCMALRWIVSGKVPMTNGYETMLFVAWMVMLLSLIVSRRFNIILTFGFIMSGFFLLVSHIGQMDPNIGNVMPVLNSPLLSSHVSFIMSSFAMLSLTFICGVIALALSAMRRVTDETITSLMLLSRLFLYPALTTLGIGIFIGAIWANVSWGQYWGWDPKEVWALITFMVYAIAVHTQTIPSLAKPLRYHTFMTLAFLTVLMTYFGVNYVLGGMHSYA